MAKRKRVPPIDQTEQADDASIAIWERDGTSDFKLVDGVLISEWRMRRQEPLHRSALP